MISARAVGNWLPAVATMALIGWFSHQPRWPDALVGSPDWLLHGGAYGFLAALCYWGASGGLATGGWRPTIDALVVASAYGAFDEWHQSFVPGRHASFGDWLADALGSLVMLAGIALVRRFGGSPDHVGQSSPRREHDS